MPLVAERVEAVNENFPHGNFILVPRHSAYTRKYIPFGFLSSNGLEMRYNYSAKVVYNNFPWCEVNLSRRQTIETTAQKILDVRAKYPDWTFAALYDESTMPDDLRDAHKFNDLAVALAYGFDKILHDEAHIVAELMKLYKRLTT